MTQTNVLNTQDCDIYEPQIYEILVSISIN